MYVLLLHRAARPCVNVLHGQDTARDGCRTRLRGACPARKTDDPVDVDVAVKLLENRGLYREAISLAAPAGTVAASVGKGASGSAAAAVELPVVQP